MSYSYLYIICINFFVGTGKLKKKMWTGTKAEATTQVTKALYSKGSKCI